MKRTIQQWIDYHQESLETLEILNLNFMYSIDGEMITKQSAKKWLKFYQKQ